MDSPVGRLRLSGTGDLLYEIRFTDDRDEAVANSTPLLEETKKQLDAYFAKKLKEFDIPVCLEGTAFQKKVWRALEVIPFGKSWSYKQLAVFLGDPKCIRAAGTANGRNPLPIVIPCHRVIGADYSLVGYGGGLWRKEWLLRHEEHPIYMYQQGFLFS